MWAIETPDVEVFDRARRDQILNDIFRLRRWWTLRVEPSFHTLGCALYQDGPEPRFLAERVRASNELLRDHFGAALEDVRSFMLDYVGGEVRWRDDLPLPGFHIFGADAIAVGETHISPHFDLQFEYAGYPASVGRDVLSLTIPIQVPTGGASLEYWPVDLPEFEMLSRAGEVTAVADILRRHEVRRVWYATGRPYVQRGLPLHRIGPSARVSPGDFRISLQCHAVLDDDDGWIVYW